LHAASVNTGIRNKLAESS